MADIPVPPSLKDIFEFLLTKRPLDELTSEQIDVIQSNSKKSFTNTFWQYIKDTGRDFNWPSLWTNTLYSAISDIKNFPCTYAKYEMCLEQWKNDGRAILDRVDEDIDMDTIDPYKVTCIVNSVVKDTGGRRSPCCYRSSNNDRSPDDYPSVSDKIVFGLVHLPKFKNLDPESPNKLPEELLDVITDKVKRKLVSSLFESSICLPDGYQRETTILITDLTRITFVGHESAYAFNFSFSKNDIANYVYGFKEHIQKKPCVPTKRYFRYPGKARRNFRHSRRMRR